jgi:hypothetical protein
MAETSAASNNKSVSFGPKMEREMAWSNRGIMNDANVSGSNPAGVRNKAPIKPEAQADGVKNPAGVKNTAPMKPETLAVSDNNPAGITNAAPMKKKPPKSARKSAKRAVKRGLISEKAAKKHLGGY